MKRKKIKIFITSLLALFSLFMIITGSNQQIKPEVPFVSTPDEVVKKMLKMANVGKDDVLYDLGCGDGRIVITAVKNFGCRGVGIDIDPQRIKDSRENAKEAGVSKKVDFLLQDLFETDIREATVVTLYLLSSVNLRLRPKLLRELAPGTRIVSHAFDMGKWEPDDEAVIENDDPFFNEDLLFENIWDEYRIFYWVIPANVTGTWKWTTQTITGNKPYTLKIDQSFQKISGQVIEDNSSIPVFINAGKIKGDRLQFILETKIKGRTERLHFDGNVRANTVKGYVRIEGKPAVKEKWQAKRIPSTIKPIDSDSKKTLFFDR